uniref:Uncharacterized protein n=1 Tax=viral metagenome TaxID=1070528 RepID=A0A6M3K430_9ZZZZ
MKKYKLLQYTQDIMDYVSEYFEYKITKEQLDAKLLDRMNEHLRKSKIRRMIES